MSEDQKQYPGCRPGWKPDLMLAERENDPRSIEEQVEAEQHRWKLDQEAESAENSAAPAVPDAPPARSDDEEFDDE